MRRLTLLPVSLMLVLIPVWGAESVHADKASFLGLRALVAQPDVVWWEWDVAIYGALEERGFEVTYGGPLGQASALSQYDLVALNTRRRLTDAEAAALASYVAQGGALYASWGGPMETSGFLRDVLRAANPRSVYIRGMTLLDGPLANGIGPREIAFAEHVGHQDMREKGWEMVAMDLLSNGLPVAKDPSGNVLGVLSQHGEGRAAVLGFGPEQEKYLVRPELGPLMLDNLLTWLLGEKVKTGPSVWSKQVSIGLPARAEITGVEMNGRAVRDYRVRRVGSVREVELSVSQIGPGQEADLRISYRPLREARNIETMIHLPWGTLRAAADSPARLADYLKSLHATVVQPLLRGGNGQAWYRGMPEDKPDGRTVTQYQGNFLSDLIRECHSRGIRVIGGIYFDSTTPVRQHPDVVQLDANGQVRRDEYGSPYACFNNPQGQEYNLATIAQLVTSYDLDGLILDDNYELDWYVNNCFCQYCEERYRRYCEAHGIAYTDPTQAGDYSRPGPRHQYRREATRNLAAKVRAITQAHGKRAGGWVSVTEDATHLAGAFDFLGGMEYTSSPRSARLVLERMGECDLLALLWAPHADPAAMQREVQEAIHSGCAAVGFWVMGEDGGYQLDGERTEAVRRAFASVEEEWLAFYRERLLSGDARFAVTAGSVGRDRLRLRLRNTGARVSRRIAGEVSVDLPRVRGPAVDIPTAR